MEIIGSMWKIMRYLYFTFFSCTFNIFQQNSSFSIYSHCSLEAVLTFFVLKIAYIEYILYDELKLKTNNTEYMLKSYYPHI